MTKLIHLPSDPKEEKDLAGSSPGQLLHMRRLLGEKLRAIDAPGELLEKCGLDGVTV